MNDFNVQGYPRQLDRVRAADHRRWDGLQRRGLIEVHQPHPDTEHLPQPLVDVRHADDGGVERGHGIAAHETATVRVRPSVQDVTHGVKLVVKVVVRNDIVLGAAVGGDLSSAQLSQVQYTVNK